MRRLILATGLLLGAAVSAAVPAGAQQAETPAPRSGAERVERVTLGDRVVPEGTTVRGPIATAQGKLEVRGRVEGSALSLFGDVIVRPGGIVTGDASSLAGDVRIEGGEVQRRTSGAAPARRVRREPPSTSEALQLAAGWLAVLAILGLVSLVAAERNVEGVVRELESRFARAFWLGIATELAILPVGVLLVVGLALTVVGVLLIPFAIVAYAIAVLGLLTLGFIATARLVGGGLVGVTGRDVRARRIQALLAGLALLMVPWLGAAALQNASMAGALFRAIALAITWVVATLGLGAAVSSRAGTLAAGAAPKVNAPTTPEPMGWQTPTPVAGVVAARRPAATPTMGER